MSVDWSAASCLTRALTRARSTLMVVAASPWWSWKLTPSSCAVDMSVISSAVAISVLLGTQSVSTAEPPTPSVSTTVTSRAQLRGHVGGLVAARTAADDDDVVGHQRLIM